MGHVQQPAHMSRCEVGLVGLVGFYVSVDAAAERRLRAWTWCDVILAEGRRNWQMKTRFCVRGWKSCIDQKPLTLGSQRPPVLHSLTCSFLAGGARSLHKSLCSSMNWRSNTDMHLEEYIKFRTLLVFIYIFIFLPISSIGMPYWCGTPPWGDTFSYISIDMFITWNLNLLNANCPMSFV